MKNRLLAFVAVGLLASCSNSKEVTTDAKSDYGPVKVEEKNAVSVASMLNDFSSKKGQETEYTFQAPLNQVCAKAGCWVNVDKGNGETFMVRFKDHFTIPTDTEVGTQAIMHGVAYQDTVSVADLRHFAEDAGESEEEIMKITEPKITMGFEADGIKLLPKK